MRLGLAALLLVAACSNVVTCVTQTADIGEICLPAPAFAPGISSVIELRELCGRGCSQPPACTALFRGGELVLDVTQDVCTDTQSSSCIDEGCQQRLMQCALPPLNAGVYTLRAPGAPPQLIHVQSGGQSSCRLTESDGGVQ